MKNNLVIVESPTKVKTIGKMLGADYVVKASMGHVRDLPKHSLGVDIEHDFRPEYEESKERNRNLSELKAAAKTVSDIYLAPDPDREGEAIAWHLREILGKANKKAAFHRVTFHEITRGAIARAFQTPGEIDIQRVDAQQARRVLDRIVGYMVSPLLWGRMERGLSAGRVQSVALRLVCEREREIMAFAPKEYWNFSAEFAKSSGPDISFTARLFKIDDAKFEIGNAADAEKTADSVRSVAVWKTAKIDEQPHKRHPAPPFITSTLQQAASSSLGFSASSTMRIAQQLYEGVDVGGGNSVGLITYMRTDSVAIATEAQQAARAFISAEYGPEYIPEKPNFYKSKASAQGAHEAIRPTDITLTPEKVKASLDSQQLRLYTLIWRRFAASQMASADELRTSVDIDGNARDSRKFTFRASANVIKFPGFLRAYNIREEGAENEEDDENAKDAAVLKNLLPGDPCALSKLDSEQKFTEPPPRFSEATLIKELESNGIGRPSTYATIVNTIQIRDYVKRDKGKLHPTELGFKINDYLVAKLPELFQVGFTAEMENELDRIEEGKLEWTGMMRVFYDKFTKWLDAAKNEGAPEADKARKLIELLSTVSSWEQPDKTGARVFDDKKFFTSVKRSADSGKKVSAKQWDALIKLGAKYMNQLPALKNEAETDGFVAELDAALDARRARAEKAAELEQNKTAGGKDAADAFDKVFAAMNSVKWEAASEKTGRRQFDDKKFYKSLKTQAENGKILSDKQKAVLGRMAVKYKAQIPSFNEISAVLGIEQPAENAAADGTAPESSQKQPSSEALNGLFAKLEKVVNWVEPKKVRGRVFDDKAFYESLLKQHKSGKVLSEKQLAALGKLASRY